MKTHAQLAGCCGANSKEACRTPPCPCNMDSWSFDEIRALRKAKLDFAVKAPRIFDSSEGAPTSMTRAEIDAAVEQIEEGR